MVEEAAKRARTQYTGGFKVFQSGQRVQIADGVRKGEPGRIGQPARSRIQKIILNPFGSF